MTPSPLVTVCIPNHNYGHLIGGCLQSVLSQSDPRLEIVVSDDGSSDNSDEVIRSYTDPRIRYVRQPHQLGIWGNFKACLSLGEAPYALFLGADDYLKPRMVEKCVSVLEANPGAAFCHTAVEIFNDEGKILETTGGFTRSYVRDGKSLIEDFLYGKRVVLSASVFRRRCFEEMDGWSIRYQNCFDAEIWFRMLLKWQAGYVGEVLAGFRKHPTSEAWRLLQVKEDLEFLEALYKRLPESLRALHRYRHYVVAAATRRALSILKGLPQSVERDDLICELSTNRPSGEFSSKETPGHRKAAARKFLAVLRSGLEKLPSPIRYVLGDITDSLRRANIHRQARAYRKCGNRGCVPN